MKVGMMMNPWKNITTLKLVVLPDAESCNCHISSAFLLHLKMLHQLICRNPTALEIHGESNQTLVTGAFNHNRNHQLFSFRICCTPFQCSFTRHDCTHESNSWMRDALLYNATPNQFTMSVKHWQM